jgi:hypothetical protein
LRAPNKRDRTDATAVTSDHLARFPRSRCLSLTHMQALLCLDTTPICSFASDFSPSWSQGTHMGPQVTHCWHVCMCASMPSNGLWAMWVGPTIGASTRRAFHALPQQRELVTLNCVRCSTESVNESRASDLCTVRQLD